MHPGGRGSGTPAVVGRGGGAALKAGSAGGGGSGEVKRAASRAGSRPSRSGRLRGQTLVNGGLGS